MLCFTAVIVVQNLKHILWYNPYSNLLSPEVAEQYWSIRQQILCLTEFMFYLLLLPTLHRSMLTLWFLRDVAHNPTNCLFAYYSLLVCFQQRLLNHAWGRDSDECSGYGVGCFGNPSILCSAEGIFPLWC